ncbi:flagellar assembly protein FliH [Helicobacter marmotae]|uniref:Flagellar assembly protein FliH n=1 Tax=Helicobacter marmotae TaxID=152490 RepID=A0A3D8I540_9HELI|nr:flagellar assembly protein FliH [Helicobacter marmotae]RDU60105.1 flagellar assembly protein FliH [Helicobacter marmotae]
MSLLNQENIIGQDRLKNHNIKKYEFKSITSEMIEISKDNPNGYMQAVTPENVQNDQNAMSDQLQKIASLEQELVERLLQKTDELSSSLAKLQIQFEKLQVESEQRVASARDEGYKDGYREGQEKLKADFSEQINAQKKALVDSVITLENTLKGSQKHLEDLEKELSAISVDIAKEVIVSEVSQNSQNIALNLTKELLASIMEATNVKIKVNPNDYLFLKEQLEENTKVEIISDGAVSLGGVVIISDSGNIDGTIMSRYKNLKQSVLENMRD